MELEEYLRQFRVSEPPADLRERVLASSMPVAPRRRKRVLWMVSAAAAAILLAVGIWRYFDLLGESPPGSRTQPEQAKSQPALEFLNGRGRVISVGDDTRVTLVDAARGVVRLDAGEIYVELPAGAGLQAEVRTPAGTATALGTRFCAHYAAPANHGAHALLAVAVLDGLVKVSNAHGHTVSDAGEMVLVTADATPEKHSGATGRHGCPYQGRCPFASVLGLVFRPEVQSELRLTEEQTNQLQRPGKNELLEICRFFRSLQPLSRDEWGPKAASFCTAQRVRVNQILTVPQQRRLREIGLQQEGLFALARTDIAHELKLTPAQEGRVDVILKDFSEAHRVLVQKNEPREDIRNSLTELRHKTVGELSELLTEAQRNDWQRLLGPPFALKPRTPHPWYQ